MVTEAVDPWYRDFQNAHMATSGFWNYFNKEASPRLGFRADPFRKIFTYLDTLGRTVGIVETGCVRTKDSWEGDGQSTILFDRYISNSPGSVVYTVDVNPDATALCKGLVSDRVKVHTGDSVAFLKTLARNKPSDLPTIDLLYLDSFDFDADNPLPSAAHHLKELLAILPAITPRTLVVVDDAYALCIGVKIGGEYHLLVVHPIWGKAKLIADYASAIGVTPYFTGYQCGWIGLGAQGHGENSSVQSSVRG